MMFTPGLKICSLAAGLLTAVSAALLAAPQDPPRTASTNAAAAQDAAQVDTSPLELKVEVAFPNVKWTGWDNGEDSGRPTPLRPILLTHAGDGSNRVFVPTQRGVIYVFPNDQDAAEAKVFLDIESKVSYNDRTNEEGFLGLTFHPKYEENGEFFVYYTNKHQPHQNVVARFRVNPNDPNQADPASEEQILVMDKPYWNHDGGTVDFGPDGYLYLCAGDGGLANDPHENGQNLNTLLGSIMRIDIDHQEGDLAYAIPADNPFANEAGKRGEIWAYGLRNVWRFAFDPKTGVLWAGDVGQDTWEEIDIIVRGGNYGWNVREGLHPFVPLQRGRDRGRNLRNTQNDTPTPEGMIDPIFEYHHDIGKSITGGVVYRGKNIPQLDGAYLYADYVSGKLWALWYDFDKQVVTANREIPLPSAIPIMSFGVDEAGEVYFTTYSQEGRGIYRLAAPE